MFRKGDNHNNVHFIDMCWITSLGFELLLRLCRVFGLRFRTNVRLDYMNKQKG